MLPDISIIISTKNRPDHLSQCLNSIRTQTYQSYEVIILDQNIDNRTTRVCKSSKIHNLIHIRHIAGWKTTALNTGLKYAKGQLIAFTDDDCIVSSGWLRNIKKYFQNNPKSVGIFGRVTPYGNPPKEHPIHPQDINLSKMKIVKKPHAFLFSELGNGNNMVFRKHIFNEVGGFNEWLGVGAPCGGGGEDGELAYRILKMCYPLTYNPSVLVYHNRWLTQKESGHMQNVYSCGSTAFTTYWMIKSGDLGLSNNYLSCLSFAFHQTGVLLQRRFAEFSQVSRIGELLYQSTKGIFIGILMWLDDILDHRIIRVIIATH